MDQSSLTTDTCIPAIPSMHRTCCWSTLVLTRPDLDDDVRQMGNCIRHVSFADAGSHIHKETCTIVQCTTAAAKVLASQTCHFAIDCTLGDTVHKTPTEHRAPQHKTRVLGSSGQLQRFRFASEQYSTIMYLQYLREQQQ